jgi:hypothetical protein
VRCSPTPTKPHPSLLDRGARRRDPCVADDD